MSRSLLWIISALMALSLLSGYIWWRRQPRQVESITSRSGRLVDLVYATGFVEAEHPVSVSARLTAPVTQVLAVEGERIKRGQPLVILDDEDVRGARAQALAQSRVAGLTEKRTVTLFSEGWVTRAARDQAVASADAAGAALNTAQARLGQNVLRSGIDGIVLKRDVEVGDLATPARVLMQLGSPNHIRITATVDERDVPRVREGQAALLSSDAWPGHILHGQVQTITPGGDPTQRAFRVRLKVNEATMLPMGLTFEVNIVTRETPKAVLVPVSAVTANHVWVIVDGHAHSALVKTGTATATDIEIVSGLLEGAQIISPAPLDLREGERVNARAKLQGGI